MPSLQSSDGMSNANPLVAYFSEEFTELKTPLRLVPRPFTAAMIASEMPAAIRPYSIAVAPVWSSKNLRKTRFKTLLLLSDATP
jgi:hypothetical protein